MHKHIKQWQKSRFYFVCECAVKHWIELGREGNEICTVWLHLILSSFFLGFCHQQHKIYDFQIILRFSILLCHARRMGNIHFYPPAHSLSFHFTKSIHFNVSQTVLIFNSILTWKFHMTKIFIITFGVRYAEENVIRSLLNLSNHFPYFRMNIHE